MAPLTPRRRKDDSTARRSAPMLAYLLIVAAMALALYTQEKSDEADEQIRQQDCAQSVANREAIRQVYRDVADLGRRLGATPERRAELREQFDQFERDRLSKIPALTMDECAR